MRIYRKGKSAKVTKINAEVNDREDQNPLMTRRFVQRYQEAKLTTSHCCRSPSQRVCPHKGMNPLDKSLRSITDRSSPHASGSVPNLSRPLLNLVELLALTLWVSPLTHNYRRPICKLDWKVSQDFLIDDTT
jgi:hypothetical protein